MKRKILALLLTACMTLLGLEKTYTVSDIEYIADTYINADGTDEFMNNNDTVSIGLLYNAQSSAVSDFAQTSLTVNSCSKTLTVADENDLVALSGGWFGIAVYDDYNIVVNQSAVIGNDKADACVLLACGKLWIFATSYSL